LQKTATVVDELGNEHRASLYFAEVGYIDAARQPYSWYKRFVIDGARQHALPGEYVNALAALPDEEDADRERDRRKRAIVC
jgi:hypothetical protein